MSESAKSFQKRQKKILKQQRRKAVTLSTDNKATNAQPSIVITSKSALDTVNRFSIGVISYALQRGYSSVAEDADFPFFSQVYLGSILINAMRSTNPGVQKVPEWLHKIMHLLAPRQAPYYGGLISYTWDIDFEAFSSQWFTDLGPFGCNREWNSGVINPSSTINNNIPEIVSPSLSYTEALGAQAWTSVLNFLTSYTNAETELISVFEESSFDKVFTGFADVMRQFGAAGTAPGALLKTARLEVPIKYPNLAAFTQFSTSNRGDITRACQHSRSASCDSLFVGGAICSGLPLRILKSNSPPIVKPIDFYEFMDVLLIWVSLMQTAYAKDIQLSEIISNDPTAIRCPLTIQEIGLLLRNEFMNAYANSQYCVQGVYPDISVNTNPFSPFICGMGTYGVRTVGMLLPQLFVENIRVTTMRYEVGKNPKAYFPQIGIYCDDALNEQFYSYMGVDSGPFPSFQSPLSAFNVEIEKKTGKDSVKATKVAAETAISLINGRASGSFYAINHPASLQELTTIWNEWLDQLRPFTGKLTTVAADGGLLAAPMINITALVSQNEELSLKGEKKKLEPKVEVPRLKVHKVNLGAPIYFDRFEIAISSEEPLQSHAWDILQSLWIRPQFMFRVTSNIEDTLTYEKMKSLTKEPNGFVLADDGTKISLANRHMTYAAAMVHARNGKPNAVMDVISDLEKHGRGGILSSLIGKGLGMLADALPI
jgi:hypothetical protein